MEEVTTDDGKANENETLELGGTEGDNTTTTNESTDDNESQKPDGGVGTGDNGKFKMWFILTGLFLCIMIAGYVVGINKHKIKEN